PGWVAEQLRLYIYGVGHHTEDDCRPDDAPMQVYRPPRGFRRSRPACIPICSATAFRSVKPYTVTSGPDLGRVSDFGLDSELSPGPFQARTESTRSTDQQA